MQFRMLKIALFTLWCFVQFNTGNDIGDINLTYNQIKQLMGSFSNENLLKAINFGIDSTDKSKFLERQISKKLKIINGSISHAQFIDSMPDEDTKEIDSIAQNILKASSYLLNMHCKSKAIPNKECVKFMSRYALPASDFTTKCLEMEENAKYYGYRRLLPASYQDGLQKIRMSVLGKELPVPRVISNIFFKSGVENAKRVGENKRHLVNEEGIVDEHRSLAVVQWTQFIEQDLSKSVARSLSNGSPIECCDRESVPAQPRFLHPSACLPIKIPSDDSHYSPLRVTCLNYVRSALAINEQCKFGAINQLNQATNKFDLSQLYGNDADDQKRLRNLNQGLLRTSSDDSSLLPQAHDTTCIRLNDTFPCYTSGDSRVNANPIITALYTIFLRSHNQIAQKLKRINPKWSDNQLFKVTRSINIAIYQKVIYNEWANVVLGKRMATEIRSKNHEHDARRYKSKKISNEFGTAAIKFYNSMLPGDVKSHHEDVIASSKSINLENVIEAVGVSQQQHRDILKLQEAFYKPRDFSKMQFLDRLMSAVLKQHAMAMDSSYVDDLSVNMYRANMHGNLVFGGDSLAYDIQRGRDHGLSSYLSYIKKCLNVKINSWDDLKSIVREDDLNRLRTIYASMHDVDLIVGGLSEILSENATIGPTFSCIISDQLISTKLSDEDFYDRKADEYGEKVAKTVENYSAARLLCDTTKLKRIQRNIFLLPSDENPTIECSDYEALPKLDLSYWVVIQKQT